MLSKQDLLEKISELPQTPGVYIFKDITGKILYIGKAKRIKNRVSSYFRSSSCQVNSASIEPRLQSMLDNLYDIEIIETKSEVEALLLEAKLIREMQPKYNIELKDEKSFLVVVIDYSDDFPRVYCGREMDFLKARATISSRTKIFGPFIGSSSLKKAISTLQGIFKFRTCNLNLTVEDIDKKKYRPCLLSHINMCSAPCVGKITKDDYLEDVTSLENFLEGNKNEVLHKLQKAMLLASQQTEFEKAAKIRDQINAIQALEQRGRLTYATVNNIKSIKPQQALKELKKLFKLPFTPKMIDGIDISNIAGEAAVGSIVRFLDGLPYKQGYRRFKIKMVKGINDLKMMEEVISRRFLRLIEEKQEIPDVLVIDGGKTHLNTVHKTISKIVKGEKNKPFLIALAKYNSDHVYTLNSRKRLTPPKNNAGFMLLKYVRDEAHRFAQSYHRLLRSKSVFSKE